MPKLQAPNSAGLCQSKCTAHWDRTAGDHPARVVMSVKFPLSLRGVEEVTRKRDKAATLKFAKTALPGALPQALSERSIERPLGELAHRHRADFLDQRGLQRRLMRGASGGIVQSGERRATGLFLQT